MKAFAIFLIVAAAFGQLEARHWKLDRNCLNAVTPAHDCCKLVPRAWWAHLKHPTDCTKFLQCDNGIPVLKDCPAGLHWSIRRDRCEWPHIARCTGAAPTTTPTPAPTTTTAASTTSPTTTAPPAPHWSCLNTSAKCRHGITSANDCCAGVPYYHDVLLQNNDDCNTFLQCVHGSPMVRPCPAGLQWNAHKCECDYPTRATCKATPTTPALTTPSTTTATPSTTAPPAPHWGCYNTSATCRHGIQSASDCCAGVPYYHDVLLQNNEDCNTFLQCVHGSPMVMPCPAGLQWNAHKCECDYPSRATCKATSTTPAPTSPSTTTTAATITTTAATTTSAPPSTLPAGSQCAAGVSSDCRHGRISAKDCCRGVPATIDVLLQNNAQCNTFIQCVHGEPMVRNCAENYLKWNADLCRCEWPNQATCPL